MLIYCHLSVEVWQMLGIVWLVKYYVQINIDLRFEQGLMSFDVKVISNVVCWRCETLWVSWESIVMCDWFLDVVTCISLDYCGRRLMSGSRDRTAMIWDVTAQVTHFIHHTWHIHHLYLFAHKISLHGQFLQTTKFIMYCWSCSSARFVIMRLWFIPYMRLLHSNVNTDCHRYWVSYHWKLGSKRAWREYTGPVFVVMQLRLVSSWVKPGYLI